MKTILPASVLVAVLVLAGSGCTQKRVVECNALIRVINGGVQDIEKGPKPDEQLTSADYKAIATTMEKIAVDAQGVQVTLPDLKKLSTEYQSMARDMAKAARDMGAADDAKDQVKLAEAQEALAKAANREDPLVDKINKLCQAP